MYAHVDMLLRNVNTALRSLYLLLGAKSAPHYLQNKVLRHIANVDRYVGIRRLHELFEIETLDIYVAKPTEKNLLFHN